MNGALKYKFSRILECEKGVQNLIVTIDAIVVERLVLQIYSLDDTNQKIHHLTLKLLRCKLDVALHTT